MNSLQRFLKDDRGVTSVEYALVALLIALAIIAGATALGVELGAAYNRIAGKFPTVPST